MSQPVEGQPQAGAKPAVSPVQAVVVMGVSGCGKSSVARAIAELSGWRFVEGDDFHSAASIAKMRANEPLDDTDRADWLQHLGDMLAEVESGHADPVVLTCSALKKTYRDALRARLPGLRFVYLGLNQTEATRRVATRQHHPFPASMVQSQFDTLEVPAADAEPDVLTVDANQSVQHLAHIASGWVAAGGKVMLR